MYLNWAFSQLYSSESPVVRDESKHLFTLMIGALALLRCRLWSRPCGYRRLRRRRRTGNCYAWRTHKSCPAFSSDFTVPFSVLQHAIACSIPSVPRNIDKDIKDCHPFCSKWFPSLEYGPGPRVKIFLNRSCLVLSLVNLHPKLAATTTGSCNHGWSCLNLLPLALLGAMHLIKQSKKLTPTDLLLWFALERGRESLNVAAFLHQFINLHMV